jgi:pyruvate-formate lyase-activating enzyme
MPVAAETGGLPIGHAMTGDALLALQRASCRHLGFSLTRACPLRCRHCIVATLSAGEAARVTVSAPQAEAYAQELAELRALGIERVSFTGGEPFLALGPLATLSAAAAASGMRCTVVTACHWAKTEKSAARLLDRFPDIHAWHLSTDVFHEEFLPADHVLTAARAVLAAGREVVVRMAVGHPPTAADQRLHQRLVDELPEDAELSVQPVVKAGRAADLDLTVNPARGRNVPCPSTGPLVRDDGSVSPCCSALIDQPDVGPFELPPAGDGLVAMYRAWVGDRALRLVRSVGFAPFLAWIAQDMPEHPVLRAIPDHPCETCTALWAEPGTTAVLQRRLGEGPVARKIDHLYETLFPDT